MYICIYKHKSYVKSVFVHEDYRRVDYIPSILIIYYDIIYHGISWWLCMFASGTCILAQSIFKHSYVYTHMYENS